MERSQTNPVAKCFTYHIARDVSVCSLCKYEMKEKHSANLERYVRSKHQAEYSKI